MDNPIPTSHTTKFRKAERQAADHPQEDIADLKLLFSETRTKVLEFYKIKYEDNPLWLSVFVVELLKGGPEEPPMSEGVGESYGELEWLLQANVTFSNPVNLWKLVNYVYLEDQTILKIVERYCQEFARFCKTLKLTGPYRGNPVLYFEEYDPANASLVIVYHVDDSWSTLHDVYEFLKNVFGTYKRYFRMHKIEFDHNKTTLILQFPDRMKQLLQACIDKYEAVQHSAEVWIESPKVHEIESSQELAAKPCLSIAIPRSTCTQAVNNKKATQASALFNKTTNHAYEQWFKCFTTASHNPPSNTGRVYKKMSRSRSCSQSAAKPAHRIHDMQPYKVPLDLWNSGLKTTPAAGDCASGQRVLHSSPSWPPHLAPVNPLPAMESCSHLSSTTLRAMESSSHLCSTTGTMEFGCT